MILLFFTKICSSFEIEIYATALFKNSA